MSAPFLQAKTKKLTLACINSQIYLPFCHTYWNSVSKNPLAQKMLMRL